MHFDAHVIGLPDYCNLVRSQLGRDEAKHQVAKMRAARDEVVRLLGPNSRKRVTELFRRQSDATCHLYCERDSFLKPLRDWVARNTAKFSAQTTMPESSAAARIVTHSDSVLQSASRSASSSAILRTVATSQTSSSVRPTVSTVRSAFRALDALGLNDALIVPLDMPKPLSLELSHRAYRLPVVSAAMLLEELRALDKQLATGKTFGVPRVPDFMCARAKDIERLARLEGLTDRFWVRFSAVVLTHLAQASLASGLCAHIGDRPLVPALD